MKWEEIHSLVGSISTRSLVARPATLEQCREALAYCRENDMTICARGAGRGYGDLALNHGQAILDMSGMNRILQFDEEKARITVEAGTRLIDIYQRVHHLLLTLPGSPTESHSSVAGAICANVNGKDGWHYGNISQRVVRLTLLLASGETVVIDRDHELFHAVMGGIGLLGIVIDATLQLVPIKSNFVRILRTPAPDTAALLSLLDEMKDEHDAAVVWVDAYGKGRRLGRSVIHTATWVERDDTEEERKRFLEEGFKRLDHHREFGLKLHEKFGPVLSFLLYAQRPALCLFNRLYYAMSRLASFTGRNTTTELFLRFNFEASFTVPPAHLVCGPRGYTVQINFPKEGAKEAIEELLTICQSSPCPPVTTILRAHQSDQGLLSFTQDGYSLNFEFHPKKRHEQRSRAVVDRLIDAVVKRNGRVHLAKDQVLTPDQFHRLYPRYTELLEIKKRLDPGGLFISDLARRVGIDPVMNAGARARSEE
jgi:decaprenylphospho-beta-D-ribofuranose 2-oxidase